MSDQMSRRGFMGAAATGAVALAGIALAGCSNTSASSEKSSEKEKAVKTVIIDMLKKRDGITIDNMTEALDRCVEDGVKEIVVQPTHLMGGLEYTDVKDELDKYADKFDKI